MAHGVGLADILRTHGPAYLAQHTLSYAQTKAWRAIVACRTEALGGHIDRCDGCGATRHVYHSCRNRHCPLCQTRAKEAWVAKRRQELLPVPYFHLVFTLPHVLNPLVGLHARAIYTLLFEAASATLTTFAANPRWLGGIPAFSLVLHTWQQDLRRHVHVHALMAGGALTATGEWRAAQRGFLFPVQALSRVFRGKFVAALAAARDEGRLTLREEPALAGAPWKALRQALFRHDWVVYAKAPLGGPAQVLEYLSRYTHRVAISNERILGMDGETVHFRVRDAQHGKRSVRLPATTFIGRFLQHVLPQGFKRIRHYGLLGPANKAARLAAARAALNAPTPDPVVIESLAAFLQRVERLEWLCCPHCSQGRFAVLQGIAPAPRTRPPMRGPP